MRVEGVLYVYMINLVYSHYFLMCIHSVLFVVCRAKYIILSGAEFCDKYAFIFYIILELYLEQSVRVN